jgi:hypothetical protein
MPAAAFPTVAATCSTDPLARGRHLTFALAGVFGLDIHVVSLLEPTLTEEELGMLFKNLPARCIVLLEDIDTAGLIRVSSETEEKLAEKVGHERGNNDWNVVDLAKALKKANQLSEEEKKKGISLSGLLNIIDGMSSPFLPQLSFSLPFHFSPPSIFFQRSRDKHP